MAYDRPTLSELISTTEAQFDARLGTAQARLPASNLSVLARVLAGGEHGLYGFIDWIARQILPDTAEAEVLDRHGSIWGVTRKQATKASGTATVTGIAGATLPTGTALQRSDGLGYLTTSAVTLTGTTAAVPVVASAAGASGNTDAGATLTLPSTLAGVSSTLTVSAGGLSGGADIEADDSLRSRILARIQQAPHGGAAFDYVTWALEVEGVTRAWVNPGYMGPHTVCVTFLCDERADPIPTATDVEAVRAAIAAARPVTAADLYVFAPVPVPLDLTIALTPGTATVKAAVVASLTDFMAREGLPGATIPLSRIREAISQATGETDHSLISPTSPLVCAFGQIAVLGTVSWA